MSYNGGSVTLTFVTVFENARQIAPKTKPRLITFDAHIYLGPTSADIGALTYYNNDPNRSFEATEVAIYFVVANVALAPQTLESVPHHYQFASGGLQVPDYALIGDVISLIPAGTEPELNHRPYIQVTGVIDGVGQNGDYWDMCPEQYIAGFHDSKSTTRGAKPCLPIRVLVPDTPRWSGKSKPKVKPGTYAAVGGYLSAIERDPSTAQVIRFAVDLGSIVFFGKASYVAGNTTSGDNPPPESPATKKGKLRFSYSSALPASKRQKKEHGPDPGPSGGAGNALAL